MNIFNYIVTEIEKKAEIKALKEMYNLFSNIEFKIVSNGDLRTCIDSYCEDACWGFQGVYKNLKNFYIKQIIDKKFLTED